MGTLFRRGAGFVWSLIVGTPSLPVITYAQANSWTSQHELKWEEGWNNWKRDY